MTPPGLESSGPVFDRASRIARTLFGEVEAKITLAVGGGFWRSSTGDVDNSASGVTEVMRLGESVWIENAALDPRVNHEKAVIGPPHVRFFAGAPIRLADGTTPGVLSVVGLEPRPYDRTLARRLQDLADFVADEWARVTARQARDDYAHRLGALVSAMPVPVVLTDTEARVLYASPPWLKARGLENVPVIGRTLFELRPDIFEPWRPGIEHCLQGYEAMNERAQVPHEDGRIEWARVQLRPWRDSQGQVGGLVIVSYDITQLVEALERTERSEERLRMALELSDLHVWEMDYVRRELVKVGAEDTFFDRPRTYKDLYADIFATIDPRDRAKVMENWENRGPDDRAHHMEYRINRGDGREVWAAGASRLIMDADGRPVRLVGAMRNITTQKVTERALLQAKEEAEAANRAKSAFLATMSHEIRTPLNGVLGMAQALAADDDLSARQRDQIEVIRQSGESLLAILNDVLDLSKVEAGKLALETAPFAIEAVARTVHATFQAIASAKGLDFELVVDPPARGSYLGDEVRVRQVLWNLVSNALKFTERGGVKVRIARERGALSLTVIDSGIGMTPAQLHGLFRKFEQADASTTRRFGGTGLGLAICRELADLMGGAIEATSAPNMGSTFTVRLPLKRARRPAERRPTARKPRAAPPAEPRPLRILAAEDNAMNQLVLKTLLAQVGIEPVVVDNGREAVEAWSREAWDLILMDVQMPIMDGPTATGLIRARERTEGRARTPILALTANAMAHQVAEYHQAGMDGVVAKPIEALRLFEAIEQAVEEAAPEARAAAG